MASSKAGAVGQFPAASSSQINTSTLRNPEEREKKIYENLEKAKELHAIKTQNSN